MVEDYEKKRTKVAEMEKTLAEIEEKVEKDKECVYSLVCLWVKPQRTCLIQCWPCKRSFKYIRKYYVSHSYIFSYQIHYFLRHSKRVYLYFKKKM